MPDMNNFNNFPQQPNIGMNFNMGNLRPPPNNQHNVNMNINNIGQMNKFITRNGTIMPPPPPPPPSMNKKM